MYGVIVMWFRVSVGICWLTYNSIFIETLPASLLVTGSMASVKEVLSTRLNPEGSQEKSLTTPSSQEDVSSDPGLKGVSTELLDRVTVILLPDQTYPVCLCDVINVGNIGVGGLPARVCWQC